MLAFFPEPYPDEIMYSIIARYHKKVGSKNSRYTSTEIFGKETTPSILYANNIDYLISQLPSKLEFSYKYFIDNHTLLPLYKPFIPPERYELLENDIRVGRASVIKMRIGNSAGNLCEQGLKYCEKCLENDKQIFGEAYFHRLHQVPGIFLCHIHLVPLKDFIVSRSTFIRYDDANSINMESEQVDECFYISEKYKSLLNSIKLIANGYLNDYDQNIVNRKYSVMLKSKGFMKLNGYIDQRSLRKDFLNYYPENFLEKFNCSLGSDSNNWLRTIITSHNKVIEPVKHMLFIRFLFGDIEEFHNYNVDEYNYFGLGPWPCLNPIADHYLKNTINDIELKYRTHTRQIYAIFSCFCGFVYERNWSKNQENEVYRHDRITNYGTEWQEMLRKYVMSGAYTIKGIAEKMGCSVDIVIDRGEKLGLGCFIKSKKIGRLKTHRKKEGLNKELQNQYRESIVNLLNETSGLSRSEVRRSLTKAFAWLAINDKDFLLSVLPEPLKRSEVVINNSIVDWEKRDNDIKNVVINAINEIKMSNKPKRVTSYAIFEKIPDKPIVTKLMFKMNMLPKTREVIESAKETLEDFKIREVDYYVKLLREKNKVVKKYMIYRSLNIYKYRFDQVVKYIDNHPNIF